MRKYLMAILCLITTLSAIAQKAKTEKRTFSRETTVSIDINASSETIWNILTNAKDFARWNSTVTSLEGEIKLGEKIALKSTLDDKRTFKLKIKEFEANSRLVWGDSKGNRIYVLVKNGDSVHFTMTEKIGGLMFPMYAKYIPPFDESFEQFAADLKREAESKN